MSANETGNELLESVQMDPRSKFHPKNTETRDVNPCPYPYSYENPLKKGCVYTEGEWLYYKAEAQIPFADVFSIRKYVAASGTETIFPDDDQEVDNTFNDDSGYRVKLGVNLPYSGWDTSFQYQQLKFSTENSVEIGTLSTTSTFNDTKLLFPYWVSAGMGQGDSYKWNAAWSTQSLNYRIFDWGIDKTFYVKNHFALTPFVGIRAS